MPADRPVTTALTRCGVLSVPAEPSGVGTDPSSYVVVVPYWTRKFVGLFIGLIDPSSVTAVSPAKSAIGCSVVAVGPAQAQRYARARRLLPLNVTLVSEADVVGRGDRPAQSSGQELAVLSVGRLDNEKNPLLLADVLAELCAEDPRWRLTVCGEGPLEPVLRERMRELGVADRVTFRGFIPMGPALHQTYRTSDVFLHVSHTEGVPQVLFEAFAAGLPVVATDVGGVAATARGAALLIPPGDAQAAASALRTLVGDGMLRDRLVCAGLRIARESTRERQCQRVAEFLQAA